MVGLGREVREAFSRQLSLVGRVIQPRLVNAGAVEHARELGAAVGGRKQHLDFRVAVLDRIVARLRAPDALGGAGSDRIGAPTVAALLLDHMTGMAASSFTQKAMDSGMLSPDEGRQVMAIVQLAEPGETEAALADHLPNRALLSFSALVSAWRNQAQRAANSAASSMRA